jgi:hypothetical protein
MKKTLTVREIPIEIYNAIKEQALRSNRSLQAQILWIMTKEARLQQGGFTNVAEKWRHKLEGRDLGDTVADIKAGRERE